MNPTWISAIEQNVSSVAISRDALGLRFPGHAGLHFGRSIELPRPGSLGSGASVPRDESHIILESLVNELSLRELRRVLRSASDQVRVGGVVTLFLLDPDRFPSDCWPGEQHSIYDRPTRYRPLRQIYEIARLFPCRVRTPRPIAETPVVRVDLERLTDIPHRRDPDPRHRYGRETAYRRFDRLEEPEILDDLVYGLASMKPRPGQRVLSIGVNDARELELFEEVGARQLELWGVDWNHSAIAAARARFPAHAHRMLEHDLSEISAIDFPKFDIVLALNTLHCTSVDRDRVLQSLTMNTTAETQWLISIPNCHFGTRDILRRPIDRSDPRHDRSRALKDLRYLTRYFYRAGYQNVTTFGTYDWMLLVRA